MQKNLNAQLAGDRKAVRQRTRRQEDARLMGTLEHIVETAPAHSVLRLDAHLDARHRPGLYRGYRSSDIRLVGVLTAIITPAPCAQRQPDWVHVDVPAHHDFVEPDEDPAAEVRGIQEPELYPSAVNNWKHEGEDRGVHEES